MTSHHTETAMLPWAANTIEWWDIDRLLPYANNARQHTDTDVELIAKAFLEFGWTFPVLVAEDGTIIAGHCRTEAARKLGLKTTPVIVARGWSEAQIRSYRVFDNQMVARGTWDPEKLGEELAKIMSDGGDVAGLGFDPEELAALLASPGTDGLTDPDLAPDLPQQPATRPADTWCLGEHRVSCGDSTQLTDVTSVLKGATPMLMVTDQPYGVGYDPAWRERENLGIGKRSKGKVVNDDRADWREAWELFPGNVAYVWHGALHGSVAADALLASGFEVRAQIIWAKQHFALSRGDYHWQHETCWYAVRKGATARWAGDRKQTTLWEIPNNNASGMRIASRLGARNQKPIECMRRPIVNNSRPGEVIL